MNIKKKLRKYATKTIKFIYKSVYKYVPVNDKTILFTAYHGRGYQCNPKYIHQYLLNNDEYKDYNFVWAVKKYKVTEIPNSKVIRYNGIKYYYYLARSKYWVFNCKMPKHVLKKENQIYVQTWHGTPLKKLAHDIEVKEDVKFYRSGMSKNEMTDTYDNDVKKYDYFVSPNRFSTEKFETSFKVANKKIIETGYPRNDFLSNITNKEIISLREKYNIPNDKKVILYAPTWRDNSFNKKGYTFKLKVDFNLWREILGDQYVVIFKPHYLITNTFKRKGDLKDFVYNISADADINELYAMSDMLITDYSSVFFDYAILKKPILFYMYDLEEYRDELRGFYLDINKDLPGPIITDEVELLTSIKNQYKLIQECGEKIERFNKKFNYLQDGNCAKKVVESFIV